MKTLIIIGHPDKENSHAQQFLIESLQHFENVTTHDIAKDYDVEEDRAKLKEADRIILQFPIYWYSCPSIVKEWIDKVWEMTCQLKGKELGLSITLGVSNRHFQAGGREKYTISEMLRPFEMLANHFEMTYLPPFCMYQFDYAKDEIRKRWLIDYQQYVSAEQPLHFKQKGEWLIEQLEKLNTNGKFTTLMEAIVQQNEQLTDIIEELEMIRNG